MRRWVLFYAIVFLLGIVTAIFEWPFLIAIFCIFLLTIIMFGNFFFTLYGTTNMNKVEKFIKGNQKKPINGYVYAQAFGTEEEQLIAIDTILSKYKQPYIQHYYRVIRAVITNDFKFALEESDKIAKEPAMSYCKAYVLALMNHFDEAKSYRLPKKWMHEAILAIIAKEENDREGFHYHVNQSIQAARGVQRFSLIHSLKQMEF